MKLQGGMLAAVAEEDAAAAAAAAAGGSVAAASVAERATAFCEATADVAFHAWSGVFLELFALTRDGFTISQGKGKPQCTVSQKEARETGCTARLVPHVVEQGYDAAWYERVAADGDNAHHYAAPTNLPDHSYEMHKRLRMNKRRAPPRGPPFHLAASSGTASA